MSKEEIKKLLTKAREYNQKSTDLVNKLFECFGDELLDARELPTASYNADCLADAITCFVAYDEWELDALVEEIAQALENNK